MGHLGFGFFVLCFPLPLFGPPSTFFPAFKNKNRWAGCCIVSLSMPSFSSRTHLEIVKTPPTHPPDDILSPTSPLLLPRFLFSTRTRSPKVVFFDKGKKGWTLLLFPLFCPWGGKPPPPRSVFWAVLTGPPEVDLILQGFVFLYLGSLALGNPPPRVFGFFHFNFKNS